jgi:hypothetical protein
MRKKNIGWTGIKDWATAKGFNSSRKDTDDNTNRKHTRYSDIHNKKGGTENDHILLNNKAHKLLTNETIEQESKFNTISDHLPITITLAFPNLPYMKQAKKRKPIREKRDIKITKKQYNANEATIFTGKTYDWHMNIKEMYQQYRENAIIKHGDNNIKLLEDVNIWLFKQTYKLYKIGPDGWTPETVVLAAYQRTLQKLQRRMRGNKNKTKTRCNKLVKTMLKSYVKSIALVSKDENDYKHLSSLTNMTPGKSTYIKNAQQIRKH